MSTVADYCASERQKRIFNSPARFKSLITKRGNWSVSPIFGRCKQCGAITIFGFCNTCRFVRVCAACNRVIQKDGATLPIYYNVNEDKVSHGICEKCLRERYPEQYKKMRGRV